MDKKNTLNGFEAVLDSFIPNVGKTNENDDILLEDVVEELTDEELEALKGNTKPKRMSLLKKKRRISKKMSLLRRKMKLNSLRKKLKRKLKQNLK